MTDEEIISAILEREGGSTYTNHPADKGGPTKYGITLETLAAHRGKMVSAEDVRQLGEAEARAIYRKRYIVTPGFDKLDNVNLRAALVDFAVHSGPGSAIKALQDVVHVVADGVMGPLTLAAANAFDGDSLARRVLAKRVAFLGRLITKNPEQSVFAAGWFRRVAEQIEALA